MKTKLIYTLFIALLIISCSEEKLEGYTGDSYIQFEKPTKDSTVFTFAYDELLMKGEVNLKVTMISPIKNNDRYFRITFVSEKSTAKAGIDFEVPVEQQTIVAQDSTAYISIPIKRSSSLSNSELVAVFRLEESSDFKPGMADYRETRLIISDKLSRPAWWNSWHEGNGLGSYSDLKFRTFIREIGITDMTLISDGGTIDYSTMRAYVLKFKYWLADNPTQDEDDNLMSVAMRG